MQSRAAALAFFALTVSIDAMGESLHVSIVPASPQYVSLAIGQSADIAIELTNAESLAVAPQVEIKPWLYFTPFVYPIEMPEQSGCSNLVPETFYPGQYLFTAGPIAPGASIRCAFRVSRIATSVNSTPLSFNVYEHPVLGPNPRNDGAVFYLGTLTDVSMQSEQADFAIDAAGLAHSTLRLTAVNHGPAPVGTFLVGGCTDVLPLPFGIESEFEGGCGANTPPICFDSGFGFVFPPLAAGASASCTLKLTSIAPYATRLDFPLVGIASDLPDPQTGGSLIDTNPSNDQVDLFQSEVSAGPRDAVPSLDFLALAALAIAILAMGCMQARKSAPQW
jgi:hypothetical protein